MEASLFLTALLTISLAFLLGLVYWAAAELPLVWRETAINTRKTEGGPQYNGLQTLASILKMTAVLIWIVSGLAIIGFALFSDQIVSSL